MEAQIHSHVREKVDPRYTKHIFNQISDAAAGHVNDGDDGCNESRRIDSVNLAGLSAAQS